MTVLDTTFTFTLNFSEEPDEGLSYRTLRDHAFDVANGDVRGAKRQTQGSNQHWTITESRCSAWRWASRWRSTRWCAARCFGVGAGGPSGRPDRGQHGAARPLAHRDALTPRGLLDSRPPRPR